VILCLAILIQYRRVTDGQIDKQTHDDSIYHTSITSRSNNECENIYWFRCFVAKFCRCLKFYADTNLILLCTRSLESKGCRWNILAPDNSITESDVIEINCEVVFASFWLTPVIQCLPETSKDLVSNNVIDHNSVNATVMYSKIVTVASRLNNVKFDCHVSFNSTSTISSSNNNNINAPDNIHLWTSPAISVKCKFWLKPIANYSSFKIVQNDGILWYFKIWHF